MELVWLRGSGFLLLFKARGRPLNTFFFFHLPLISSFISMFKLKQLHKFIVHFSAKGVSYFVGL